MDTHLRNEDIQKFDNYRKLINVEKYLPKSIRIAFDWTKRIVFTLGPYFSFSQQLASQ